MRRYGRDGVGSDGGRAASRTALRTESLDARVESILQRMTVEEKVGQLVQYSAGQPTGPGTGRTDYDDMIARGQIGSLFNVVDPHEINKYQKIAMEKVAAAYSDPVWARRDSRIQNGISHSAGTGVDLGSVDCGEGVSRGGDGGCGRRHPLDIFADGGHRAGCALGTDGGRRGRRSVSGFGDGSSLCEGLSRIAIGCAGQHRGLCQALCWLWSGRGWARLQQHRDFRTHVAAVLYAAISCGRGSRNGVADERIQFAEWSAVVGQSIYVETSFAKRVGLSRTGGQRLECGGRTDSAWHCE